MPFWIKFILMFWVCTAMMHVAMMVDRDKWQRTLTYARLTGYQPGSVPWYMYMYGFCIIVSFFLIIPFAAWFVFLR